MDEPLALGVAERSPVGTGRILRWLGAASILLGVVLAAVEVARAGAWGPVLARLSLGAFGWGPLVGAVSGLVEARRASIPP